MTDLRSSAVEYGERIIPLQDRAREDALAASTDRHVVVEFDVPKETGRALVVKQGQVLRITCHEGPQVCDFNAFAADDPSEHFWSGRTRTLKGTHLTIGRRLWSTEPKMRPMFTIIADTVPHPPLPHNPDPHDLVFARCSRRAWEVRFGFGDHPNCNDNLVAGLAVLGFLTSYVHDAFNIFMATGIDEGQRLVIMDPLAQRGDFVELVAEIDAVVAISCCPGDCNGGTNRGLRLGVYDVSV